MATRNDVIVTKEIVRRKSRKTTVHRRCLMANTTTAAAPVISKSSICSMISLGINHCFVWCLKQLPVVINRFNRLSSQVSNEIDLTRFDCSSQQVRTQTRSFGVTQASRSIGLRITRSKHHYAWSLRNIGMASMISLKTTVWWMLHLAVGNRCSLLGGRGYLNYRLFPRSRHHTSTVFADVHRTGGLGSGWQMVLSAL